MYQFNLPLAKDMKWSQIETEKFPITSISTSAFFAIIYKRGEPLNSKMVAEKKSIYGRPRKVHELPFLMKC